MRVLESVIQVPHKKPSRIERSFFVSKIEIFGTFTKGNRRDDRDLDIRIDRVPGLKFMELTATCSTCFYLRFSTLEKMNTAEVLKIGRE